jgi:hypothetical protein
MTEDRFRQLLDKLFAQEQRLDLRMNIELAKFYGQVSRRTEESQEKVLTELRTRTEQLLTIGDGISARIITNEQERAAITYGQNRHEGWIKQLAETTKTNLIPEA